MECGNLHDICIRMHTCVPTPALTDKHIHTLSVQFSRSVVSDSVRAHESQHARPPCPSPTPGVHPDSCPSSQWCYPAISSSVVPFSSCPQSLPASESFPMSQLLHTLYFLYNRVNLKATGSQVLNFQLLGKEWNGNLWIKTWLWK